MKTIHIIKPVFQGHTTYGWDYEKYGKWGIGISEKRIKQAEKEKVKIKISYYTCEADRKKKKKQYREITPSLFRKYAFGESHPTTTTTLRIAPLSKFSKTPEPLEIFKEKPKGYYDNERRVYVCA